jgi:hypothetical protein
MTCEDSGINSLPIRTSYKDEVNPLRADKKLSNATPYITQQCSGICPSRGLLFCRTHGVRAARRFYVHLPSFSPCCPPLGAIGGGGGIPSLGGQKRIRVFLNRGVKIESAKTFAYLCSTCIILVYAHYLNLSCVHVLPIQ